MTYTPTCQQEILFNSQNPQQNGQNGAHYFKHCSKSIRAAIHYFLVFRSRGLTLHMAQETIGKHIHVSREHVNRIIKDLVELGILTKTYRHMRTCIYKLSQWFYDPTVQLYLSNIFSVLRKVMLIPAQEPVFGKKITQYKKEDNYSISKCIYNYKSYSLQPYNFTAPRERFEEYPIFIPLPSRPSSTYDNKRKFMEHEAAPYEFRNIRLTPAGLIRLSAFPTAALRFGDGQLASKKHLDNAFGLLFKICLQYCRENKITPDWNRLDRLSKQAGITEETPLVINKSKPPVAATSSSQKREGWKDHTPSAHEQQISDRIRKRNAEMDQTWRQQQKLPSLPTRPLIGDLNAAWIIEQLDSGFWPADAVMQTITQAPMSDIDKLKVIQHINGKALNLNHNKQKPKFNSPVSEEEETSFEFGF